jgi:hypothetical protein
MDWMLKFSSFAMLIMGLLMKNADSPILLDLFVCMFYKVLHISSFSMDSFS